MVEYNSISNHISKDYVQQTR